MTEPTPNEAPPAWLAEVEAMLERAAALCAEHGLNGDAFMHAAWSAFLDSRPGLREQIADAQLEEQIAAMRERGHVGEA